MSQGNDRPAYSRIADDLRAQIQSGDPPAGGMLRSEASLARSYGVARGTVRQALAELVRLGLVVSEMGKGSRVTGETVGGHDPAVTRYEIVAHSIRKQVASGSLGRNQQLPGEEALAEQFSVSKGTARQALQMLADEGLVTAVHGKGWFVGNAQTPLTRADEIAHLIREQIISGNIPAGTQLAGENQLAQQYSAARGTVRRAIATLEAEGYLESRRGQGRTVTKRTEPDGSEATTGPAKRLPT